MSTDTKPSNPKEGIGETKLPLHLVPDTAIALESMAFLEGALKYGKYNWRAAGVRISTYLDAFDRHHRKFKNGEWADPKTRVPHLASMRACLGIIIDAYVCGKLTDDRPPAAPVSQLIDSLVPDIAHLKELFKDYHPHQHTILDAESVVVVEGPVEEVQLEVEHRPRSYDDLFRRRMSSMNDDWQREG